MNTDLTPIDLYFDNAATTPLAPEVHGAMRPFLDSAFGNASSVYPLGVEAATAIERARLQVAEVIGGHADEVHFTASGTESDVWALRGVIMARRLAQPKRTPHVVSCVTEHSAIIQTLHAMEEEGLCTSTLLGVGEDGRIDPEDVRREIIGDTALISLMLVNSESGVIHPISDVAQIAREREIPLHCDACQGISKIPVDIEDLGVDLLTLNAHKFHGPKGVGALWINPGVAIRPLITGGGQEGGLRAGTENVACIVGMGSATALVQEHQLMDHGMIDDLRARILEGIQLSIDGVWINSPASHSVRHILNVSFEGLDGRRLVSLAGERGIALSAGSACSAKGDKLSPVLTAMGIRPERAKGALRISLGRFSTEEGVAKLIEELPGLVKAAREA